MLAHTDSGSGSTILFLHGLGLNRNFWTSTINELHSNRCIAIDLPGHGESHSIATDGSMTSYAAAVRGVIEKLHLADVTLVGHSMGGQIALILALQMPSVISKLVLVCAAGIEPFTTEEASQLKAVTQQVYANPISDDVLNRTFYHANAEIRALLMHEHVVHQRGNFRHLSALITSSVAGMLNEPVSQFLPGVTQPTLVINGAMDTAIPNRWLHPKMTVNDIQNASKAIKNSKQLVFPMAGHYLAVDSPKDLAHQIHNFS